MRGHRLILPLLVSSLVSSSALAQSPAVENTIRVEGQISNGTAGAPVPPNLPLMLHTYQGEMMTLMTDGASDRVGRFVFDDVATGPDHTFEVMVTHREVSYFSEVQTPDEDQSILDLPVRIYETTADPSAVLVEQAHVLLDFTPGLAEVTNVYILSNEGDRTVAGSEDSASLRFRLPFGATNLVFDGDPQGTRFARLTDGFSDSAPVRPGRATQQIVVGYILPYEGQLQVELPVDYPTASLNILLPEAGVTLTGPGLGPAEERLVQGRPYLIHRRASSPAGATLTFQLKGQPIFPSQGPASLGGATGSDRLRVAIGGVALSLILIATGLVWWWRGRLSPVSEAMPAPQSVDKLESLVQAIADLDDAREAGSIGRQEYESQRASLLAQAVGLLGEQRGEA